MNHQTPMTAERLAEYRKYVDENLLQSDGYSHSVAELLAHIDHLAAERDAATAKLACRERWMAELQDAYRQRYDKIAEQVKELNEKDAQLATLAAEIEASRSRMADVIATALIDTAAQAATIERLLDGIEEAASEVRRLVAIEELGPYEGDTLLKALAAAREQEKPKKQLCPNCGGRGHYEDDGDECASCDGAGELEGQSDG